MNKRIAATLVTAVSAATLTLTAPAANASATGCNGDVCIHLGDPSGGRVSVRGWAYDRTFYGRFHLTGPDGISQYSIWNTNHAGAAGHTFTRIGVRMISKVAGVVPSVSPSASIWNGRSVSTRTRFARSSTMLRCGRWVPR